MTKFFNRLITLIILGALAGCAMTGAGRLPEQGSGKSVLTEAYHIDVGDQVQISVWNNPDLSIAEPVRPDGMIAVPLVGDIMAAGQTPEALGTELENRLSSYVKNPNVTVILTGLQGQSFLSRIRVTGAVNKNTSMSYHQHMTVLDAVLDAGSVTLYADANRTKLHRRTEKGTDTYDIRLKDILENGDMRTNVFLQPGDVITVPESVF